jgi:hypothetical protein
LALLQSRFRVVLEANDPRTGRTELGQAIAQGDRFGYFSLPGFTGDASFPEVFVKMADARSLPGASFWTFHTGLTDLQYTMTVTDGITRAVRTYHNDRSDPARLCGGADTAAFQESVFRASVSRSEVVASPAPQGPASAFSKSVRSAWRLVLSSYRKLAGSENCVAGPNNLCLLGDRFRVTLSATDPRTGRFAVGQALAQGDRFGYFSLPAFTGDPTFPEVLAKMVDATTAPPPIGGFFWVFHTGLTDLQYSMTVVDTVTGTVKVYQNDRSDPSRLCGGADTAAFR